MSRFDRLYLVPIVMTLGYSGLVLLEWALRA